MSYLDYILTLDQELYEPLWADLHGRLKSAGVDIRSIWIADVANQGASSILNEYKLGNERNSPLAPDEERQSTETKTQLAHSTTPEIFYTWSIRFATTWCAP